MMRVDVFKQCRVIKFAAPVVVNHMLEPVLLFSQFFVVFSSNNGFMILRFLFPIFMFKLSNTLV